MIREKIEVDMKQAMRDRDKKKLEVLRYMWSDIKNAEIDEKKLLEDDAIIALLRREVKKRAQSIEQFASAGRDDLVTHEKNQLVIIEAYLPKPLSEEEITNVVEGVIAGGVISFGLVMKTAMDQLGSAADGKIVSDVVRSVLSAHDA